MPNISLGQGKSKDVIALEKKADKIFKDQLYSQAKDIYSTLLSNYPKDPFYSFRFGVCLLYGDRRNMEKPIQYLELAAKAKDIDPEVYYYLGQAYHFNYRFNDAIRLYQKYRSLVSNNKAARKDVDRQIEMCQNGLMLLSRVKDLFVIQRKEVKQQDFYRNYDLSGFGGEILQEPPIFKSKLDIRKAKTGLMFFPRNQDIVLFSSYGKDGKNGKDIYYSTMLPDMTWSKPQQLKGLVNTPFDEDYPFLLPDGKTLYFASKGHNSMGGYDIFRSMMDTVSGEWKQPENLDFAINTPFDDQLFVTDPYQHYAYFSSDRTSVDENIMVYMVRVDKRPEKIQEINLEAPLAEGAEDDKVKRSVEIIKQMADLNVNSANDNYNDSIVAIATAEIIRPSPVREPETQKPGFEISLQDKIKENEIVQAKVDSSFVLVEKMEESLKKLDKTADDMQTVIRLTSDRRQKEIASGIAAELSKESARKWNKLAQAQSLSASVQQLAATGKPDSATLVYENLKNKITPSDTAADYKALVIGSYTGTPAKVNSKAPDDFLVNIKPLKSKEDKDRLTGVFDLTQAQADEVTFVTKVITPKEEKPQEEAGFEKRDTVPETKPPVIQQALPEKTETIRNPEVANSIINSLIAQKDTLEKLLIKTQRQKLLLLGMALDKSNESGSKFNEASNLEGVLETVITEGSARDMKNTIRKIKNEGSRSAEEAILDYTLAVKLGEREKIIEKAIKEVENQSVVIEKTLDSGKVEKAKFLSEVLIGPVQDYNRLCKDNDDIISTTHRQAREMKINVISNLKLARLLAVGSKSSSDLSANLKKQAESHMDKTVSKNLMNEAGIMDKQSAEKQAEALEIFNQNLIWQNRSKALENTLPLSRNIMQSLEEKVSQENFKPPKKKIRDTVLLVPVMLDLLSNVLPANDTAYEKLATLSDVKNKTQKKAFEEIIQRTEFTANVDDKLLAAQQKGIGKGPDQLVFRKPDAKEIEVREKLALLNDTIESSLSEESKTGKINALAQWDLDKPSFILLKDQVDTLYNKIKRQPQLTLPSTLNGLFEELSILTDSLSQSFNEYRQSRMSAAGKKDTARIAMSLELEAFEVKATVNRLKYLINRLHINELSEANPNLSINQRPQPDSAIAADYFYAADSKREAASVLKDKKKTVQLLRQADELEKKGIEEQLGLEAKMKEAPLEAAIAVIGPQQQKIIQPQQPPLEKPQQQKETKKADELPTQQTRPLEEKTVVKPAVVNEPVIVQNDTQKTEPLVRDEKPQTVAMKPRSFISSFIDKPILTLTPAEISKLEYEISQSSERSTLPMLPGLMYSVQVGVYKVQRSSSQLFNINPLYEDIMNNGFFRYFSGIFGERKDAVAYKNLMVQKGVADAFVVIFYKGRKITAAEAEALTGESITRVIRQEKLDQISKQRGALAGEVYFSVQLAAYRRALTNNEINYYSQKSKSTVKTMLTETGLTVVVTGIYKDYNSSLEARKLIIDQGITDAFIVGFIDGKRVMAYQARAALNPAR
jgi:hypothetical protein